MNFSTIAIVLWSMITIVVACNTPQFSESSVKDVSGAIQVNSKAFNAYNMWRDGKGTPILDYPAGYEVVDESKMKPDAVFYMADETYWGGLHAHKFRGSVTEGAKVGNDILIYSSNGGRTLVLKFSPPSEKEMDHMSAVQYCKDLGLRLPHVQEILDFCASGTEKNAEGTYVNNRCRGATLARSLWWTAAVSSSYRDNAWRFNAGPGVVGYSFRSNVNAVRCVGGL
jgi:hypothetical protein